MSRTELEIRLRSHARSLRTLAASARYGRLNAAKQADGAIFAARASAIDEVAGLVAKLAPGELATECERLCLEADAAFAALDRVYGDCHGEADADSCRFTARDCMEYGEAAGRKEASSSIRGYLLAGGTI